MSATLGALLTELQPDWRIRVYEQLDALAQESSDPWNNAGTGHAALCELNYTPQNADGSVDTTKALAINEQFHVSRQYWAHLVETGRISSPSSFINPVPHISFATGDKGVSYLNSRHKALKQNPLFADLEISEDRTQQAEWLPLMFKNREDTTPIAISRIAGGTDVDFGSLSRQLFDYAESNGVEIRKGHKVTSVKRRGKGWRVTVKDNKSGKKTFTQAKFVFVGAGGGALHLLQQSGIPEGRGYGGFPVSGQFLRTANPEVVAGHQGKVYGQAAVGAPPMSVPHLDTRVVDGKSYLLFGPYAGFSPKFLKKGRVTDLPTSVRPSNLGVMLAVARDNFDLVKYLVGELVQSKEARFKSLREFVPDARPEDWDLITAGQRVQIMKKDAARGGALGFGTEVISAADGSIAALLGASPGASTAVPIMLGLLTKCFPEKAAEWEPKFRKMIPSYGKRLNENPELLSEVTKRTDEVLGLHAPQH
ncbi:malate:quinone oxidoreductase [Saxibacter everestensis]|uniref:Probable malate:quinone oxidoreductase n=1 Tax=Saxibacter everestensis TaxID=2909229 RepID=A0ABY8R0Z0_9MICO|nr:malate:quinone oxidoreductase [Brevibacteriaceae bacterium ZFBP1038]